MVHALEDQRDARHDSSLLGSGSEQDLRRARGRENRKENLARRVKTLDEPALFELLDESNVHERLGVDAFRFRILRGDLLEHEAHPADSGIRNTRQLWSIEVNR